MSTAPFPQVIVEAGFAPATPGVGSLTFLLDSVTQGILGTDELGSTDQWTDITADVRQVQVSRQSTRQQGPFVVFQGGTVSILLDNSAGSYDPANVAGPYVNAGVTQIRPMIPLRVRAIWDGTSYPLWQGFTTSWTPPAVNFGPQYDQTLLVGDDAFRILTNVNLATLGSGVGASELSGARIARILTSAGWYSSARGMSVIATGQSQMQATTYGTDALSLLQLTADSELGEIYIDAQGRFTFRDRHSILQDTRSNTVQGVFGDLPGTSHAAGTELQMSLVERPDDDTTMINDVQATIVGSSNMQEATNAASIATFLFERTYQRSDLILTADAQALNWADYVVQLAADDEFRFDQVTINPVIDATGALWPQALGRELGDRIQVWRRPPGVTAYSKDLFIRGITHTWDGTGGQPQWWETKWTTQNAARYGFFILDSATLGILDTDALAY